MQFVFTNTYPTKPYTYVTYEGTHLALYTEPMLRPKKAEQFERLYYHLNWFISTLPKPEQTQLFEKYKTIANVLAVPQEGHDVSQEDALAQMPEINETIKENIADILDILTLPKLNTWLQTPGVYKWPSSADLPKTYGEAISPKYPIEKTYVRHEYQELFALILQLRAIVPIWAAYIYKFQSAFSSDFRDMYLMSLLEDSSFADSSAYQRLQVYIDAWIEGHEDNRSSGVMHGIMTEDFPKWVISSVLVRKLALQSFDPPTPGDTTPFVIKHLSNTVNERITKSKLEFNDPKDKATNKTAERTPIDEKRSVFESNSNKQLLSNEAHWTIQVWCEDWRRVIQALEPLADAQVNETIASHMDFNGFTPSDEQMLLAMWVNATIVSPSAEPDLTHHNAAVLCACAAMSLWYRGHIHAATWITSKQGPEVMRDGLINHANIRHPKEKYELLEQLFPYNEKIKATSKTYAPIRDTIVDMLSVAEKHTWIPQLPKEMVQRLRNDEFGQGMLSGDENNPVFYIRQTMASILLDVVTDLASRPATEKAWDKATRIANEMGLPPVATAFNRQPAPQIQLAI